MEAKKPDNDNDNDNDNEDDIKEKTKKKFIPPSLDEIEKYVLEKKLSVDAKKFYEFFTEGNWIDSKGNKVRNWKQKLLTWNGYSNSKKQDTKANFEERKYTKKELDFLYANNNFEGE